MPSVIEELVIALSYDIDTKQLDEARRKAKKAADEIENGFVTALGDVEDSFEDVGDAAEKTGNRFREVWTGALRQIGARLTDLTLAGAQAFAAIASDAFEDVRALDSFTQATGTSIENVSALTSGFRRLRIEADVTQEGIKTFRENLGELDRIGTGPALDSLQSLGLTLEDFDGLNIQQQMGVLADAIQGVEDPAKQLSIAIELMGEDGAKLLPALKLGSSGVNQLTDSAREAGQVIDQETVESTRKLDQAMGEVKGSLQGAALAILKELAPQLEGAGQKTEEWIAENRDLISQDIPNIMRAIADSIGPIADALTAVTQGFSDAKTAALSFANELADSTIAVQLDEAGLSDETRAASDRRVARGMQGLGANNPFGAAGIARAEAARDEARRREKQAEIQTTFQDAHDAAQRRAETERRRRASKTFEDQEKAKQSGKPRGGGRRGRGSRTDPALEQALLDVEDNGLADELRRLAEQNEATETALEKAIQSAARSLAGGASRGVARRAGLGTLGGLVGADLTSTPTTDPLLSEIFGDSSLPDAPLSTLTQNRQPQVLISNITNTFTITQQNAISGVARPDLVPDTIVDALREMLTNEVQRESKTSKVNFAR